MEVDDQPMLSYYLGSFWHCTSCSGGCSITNHTSHKKSHLFYFIHLLSLIDLTVAMTTQNVNDIICWPSILISARLSWISQSHASTFRSILCTKQTEEAWRNPNLKKNAASYVQRWWPWPVYWSDQMSQAYEHTAPDMIKYMANEVISECAAFLWECGRRPTICLSACD